LVWTMRLVRARHLLITVTAMLALYVSAVSACACSHHEPIKKAVENSCHGPSHEAPTDEQANLLGSHFESDCECYVRTPVPAIVAKKDDKRTVVEKQIVEVVELSTAISTRLDASDRPKGSFEPPISNYQHALLASLPSRAPPRL
jgi:hypothetical protein